MKTPLAVTLAALFLIPYAFADGPAPSSPPESAQLDRAFVTIPYSELRSLWEAGQEKKGAQKPEPAPMGSVTNRAECVLELGEASSVLNAAFEIEALEPKWDSILLLGGRDARLEKVEAGERTVIWQDGYRLLTNQVGKSSVELGLVVPGLKTLTHGGALELAFGSATIKRLQIAGVPAGMEARVNGRGASEIKNGRAVFQLSSEAGAVTLQLAAIGVEKPIGPSVWEVESQVLVRYNEGQLRFESHLLAHADAGSGDELSLLLPGNAMAVSVSGEDLAEWSARSAEDGHRVLNLRWKSHELLDHELMLNYGTPQSPLAEEWPLQTAINPQNPESRTLYAIVPAEGMELNGEILRGAVAAHRLPKWMREAIGGASFVTAEGGPQLKLQAHWLPEVATAEAVVSESKSQLRFVADGSMQTEASFTIRHQAPLAWRLELPANVEILSCVIGGRSARPVQREKSVIELSLAAPVGGSKSTTAITLVYVSKSDPLDPVSGRIALELPRTALFIEHLDWEISIPRQFEITAFDGNLSVATNSSPSPNNGAEVIRLNKELCQGERPTAELFYQRRPPEK